MLKTETVMIGERSCTRTYSDSGVYIRRDGQLFESALDPAELGRTYEETDQPIPEEEAQVGDYQNALREMGVAV